MQQSSNKELNGRSKSATKATKPKPTKRTNDNLELVEKVLPKTEGQRQMMFAYDEGYHIVAYGSAGTGKSFVACYLALKSLFERKIDKIVIVRSAVATRDQGFLPGSLDEKSDPYKIPYKQIINQLCGSGTAWDILTKKNMVEFITSSYVRGITIDNCDVIVDEFANMNWHEANSIITRIGENCQVLILGDIRQCDLNKKKEESCFDDVIKICSHLPDWFDLVEFKPKDIVRSDFVRDWIIKTEEFL